MQLLPTGVGDELLSFGEGLVDGVELAGVVGAPGGPHVPGLRGAGDDWAAGL